MSPKSVAASHEEVYRAVVEQNLRSASDLFEFAEQEASVGNKGLYLYCVGSSGKAKRNLAAIVKALWSAHEKMKERASMAEATAAPLSKEEIDELKARARTKPDVSIEEAAAREGSSIKQPPLPSRRRVFFSPMLLGLEHLEDKAKSARKSKEASQSSKTREVYCFSRSGPSATITFRPKALRWRLREYYQLLVALRSEPSAQGAFPSDRTIFIPRSNGKPCAELRFTLGDISWLPSSSMSSQAAKEASSGDVPDEDRWIDDIPASDMFDVDAFDLVPAEGRVVSVTTWTGVEDHHMLAFCRAIERCGHDIEKTLGFKFKNGVLLLEHHSDHNRPGLHRETIPFGILAAPLIAQETTLALKDAETSPSGVKRKASQALPQPYLLTRCRVSKDRPAIACPDDVLKIPDGSSSAKLPALTDYPASSSFDDTNKNAEAIANENINDDDSDRDSGSLQDQGQREENTKNAKTDPLAKRS
eukprot:CAMPEP_0206556466 /NCGR_PEP_ID=MMETSP0325_2-20121206/18460_1 /ASSEMBLY_ACC=CAM_ASM_000347 /TAXON_ID=2866 /ORGANISM="Crypthecodinium cohnii, Strain Seligo" /LENGTH=474 /DNA_ID=CAMNT_0054057071 /DNA_START=48 /DNA_END=1471 /DNA_ORIENTATION=+